ncbi:MAG: hypothetical protein N2116_07425 [Armatimonadetes bacterium]|nr:hypothetical protein [Armatimonadota bacterium]
MAQNVSLRYSHRPQGTTLPCFLVAKSRDGFTPCRQKIGKPQNLTHERWCEDWKGGENYAMSSLLCLDNFYRRLNPNCQSPVPDP